MSGAGESGEHTLAGRVERLEREVEELRQALGNEASGALAEGERVGAFAGITTSERGGGWGSRLISGSGWSGGLRSGEWWLNRVGIGLLLFGVAFLFIYSVERGWIGPWMRVGVGFSVGVSLLALGLRVYERRRAFSQVLSGGGVGAFYISGFAAYQLYSLVPHPVAFAGMAAVTLLAFSLSLRADEAALSLIGALGGLGTPFLLYDDSGTLGGLVLYTCLILAGMVGVYLRKGWVSLLAVSCAGGWLVLLVGYADALYLVWDALPEDRRVLQTGVLFAWVLYALAPVAREHLGGGDRSPSAHAFAVGTPLVAFAFTALIWELPAPDLAPFALAVAGLYALGALALRGGDLGYTHALVALVFLTLAAVLELRGNALLFALAAEAAALHYLARRFAARAVSAQAHALFFVVAAWLGVRLLADEPSGTPWGAGTAVPDAGALVDLLVIGLAFGASLVVLPRDARLVYRVVAHAAVLVWLWRELSPLPGGEAYVTVAWGLYAAGLLVAGLRLDRRSLARGGTATLALVVGKLFLVDLAEVEAFWRVLLFSGFGVLFLSLSYYLRALWRPARRESGRGDKPA